MIHKRVSIRRLPVYRRYLGLTALSVMKIKLVKKRLAQMLLLQRKFRRNPQFHRWKLEKLDRMIKFLVASYFKLAFYDDSGLQVTATGGRRRQPFYLEKLEEPTLRDDFRFSTRDQLRRLKRAFAIPELVRLDNGSLVNADELLLVSLYKLHYPEKYNEMQAKFEIDYTTCSRIFNYFIQFMTEKWGYLLMDNMQFWVNQFPVFADAIEAKIDELSLESNSPLDYNSRIFALLDASYIHCCKPYDNVTQQSIYTKHKKFHGIKFQVVVLPNGMKFHVFHPIEARRHDSFLLTQSQFLPRLVQL